MPYNCNASLHQCVPSYASHRRHLPNRVSHWQLSVTEMAAIEALRTDPQAQFPSMGFEQNDS